MTGLFLCLVLFMPPALQDPTPASPGPTQPAPVRLNGIWDLNKDISTKPVAAPGELGDQGGRSRGGSPGGGSMPGGGGGRMGGGRGGGMRGGGGGRGNPEDMRKARDLMQELGKSPVRLTIVSHPDAVTLTDDDGVIRKFVANGKGDKVAMNGSEMDVKTKWDGEVLTQEFKAGSAKFTRTIETTIDGHQLVITIMPKGDGGGMAGPAFLRFVYDRSHLQ